MYCVGTLHRLLILSISPSTYLSTNPTANNKRPKGARLKAKRTAGEAVHFIEKVFLGGIAKTKCIGVRSLYYHRTPILDSLMIHKFNNLRICFLCILTNYSSISAISSLSTFFKLISTSFTAGTNNASNSALVIFSFSRRSLVPE